MSRFKPMSAARIIAAACVIAATGTSPTRAVATIIADASVTASGNFAFAAFADTDSGILRNGGNLADSDIEAKNARVLAARTIDVTAGVGAEALRAGGDPTVFDLMRMLALPADSAIMTAELADASVAPPIEENDATPSALTDPYIRVAVPALAVGGLLVSGFLLRALARRRRRHDQIRAAASLSKTRANPARRRAKRAS
jgi:hypothetical protein